MRLDYGYRVDDHGIHVKNVVKLMVYVDEEEYIIASVSANKQNILYFKKIIEEFTIVIKKGILNGFNIPFFVKENIVTMED